MLSCQQESTWMGSPDYEMDYIEQTTGKLPAMRGLDFMNADFQGVVERSKAWHERGGLVTICWHTGDNYCDIIGSDTYDNSTHSRAWAKLQTVTDSGKPLAFHECGNVPPVEDFERDGCLWSWFMVWHTDHIKGNDADNLWAVYNSDTVITLDELPEFH